jgi:PAS domain S-box-containing protein
MTAWEPLLRRDRELASFLAKHAEGLHWLGADGRVLWANAAVLDLLGYQDGEYVGHPLSEFLVDDSEGSRLLGRLASGDPVRSEVVRLRARDGSSHPVMLSASGSWADGQFVHTRPLEGSHADLAEAEQHLVDSEARFHAAFERAPEAVVITDDAGRYVEANAAACALHQRAKQDLLGRSLEGLCVDRGSTREAREQLERSGQHRGECRLMRGDGSAIVVEYAVNAAFLPGRQLWVMRDVTERRRLEDVQAELLAQSETAKKEAERAREDADRARADAERARAEAESASRAKDEFLATLSHELRTPLNAIVGWAHLLRGGDMDRPTLERGLETIERNAKAQNKLIAEILDVSRIVTGKLRLAVRPFDVRDAIEGAVESIRPAAQARGVHLDVSFEGAPPELVSADPDRLQQVVWNLLSNAVKFSAPGDHVRVRAERGERELRIVVEDTGEGIPPELVPHVFERFRQGDSSSTRRHGGLGLGLAIVRHLVELHGGQVEAESPGRGGGSRFTVRLPHIAAGVREAASTWPADEPDVDVPRLDGIRVLVVDDAEDARELARTILERQGARVQTAGSAGQALGLVDGGSRFDVMLVDLAMPHVDGCELVRQLRTRPADQGGRTPAAAVTAYAQAEDRIRALRAGFQIHLAKPVRAEEMATVVASLARGPLAPGPA